MKTMHTGNTLRNSILAAAILATIGAGVQGAEIGPKAALERDVQILARILLLSEKSVSTDAPTREWRSSDEYFLHLAEQLGPDAFGGMTFLSFSERNGRLSVATNAFDCLLAKGTSDPSLPLVWTDNLNVDREFFRTLSAGSGTNSIRYRLDFGRAPLAEKGVFVVRRNGRLDKIGAGQLTASAFAGNDAPPVGSWRVLRSSATPEKTKEQLEQDWKAASAKVAKKARSLYEEREKAEQRVHTFLVVGFMLVVVVPCLIWWSIVGMRATGLAFSSDIDFSPSKHLVLWVLLFPVWVIAGLLAISQAKRALGRD